MSNEFPDPAMVPGVERFDEEGNDKIYEHEVVSKYWLDHYSSGGICMLCENRGIVKLELGLTRPFCICPNGQAMRWHTQGGTNEA